MIERLTFAQQASIGRVWSSIFPEPPDAFLEAVCENWSQKSKNSTTNLKRQKQQEALQQQILQVSRVNQTTKSGHGFSLQSTQKKKTH